MFCRVSVSNSAAIGKQFSHGPRITSFLNPVNSVNALYILLRLVALYYLRYLKYIFVIRTFSLPGQVPAPYTAGKRGSSVFMFAIKMTVNNFAVCCCSKYIVVRMMMSLKIMT